MSNISTVTTLFIEVPIHFASSWWFKLLALLLLGFIVKFIYDQRVSLINERHRNELLRQEENLQLELKALRAQMNPHFLFNSLNSIKNFILSSDSHSAAKYLSSFAHLIRLILQQSSEKRIVLSEELEMLRLYLELEELRFKKNFQYQITLCDDIDPEELSLPPLILQPFIENAIWHGLSTKEGDRRLWIKFQLDSLSLVCVIEDNGIGRAASNRASEHKLKSHKSMGMNITQQRLDLINELEKLNLKIEITDLFANDNSPSGTRIEIVIPQNTYQI